MARGKVIPLDGKIYDKKLQPAMEGLLAFLREELELTGLQQVSVYGVYAPSVNLAQVVEIGVFDGFRGYSFQRSNPDCLGLCAACEDFITTFHVKPTRPQGWAGDLDIHLDAKDALKDVIQSHKVPNGR